MSNVIKSEEQITHLVGELLNWMDKFEASHEPMDLGQFFTFTAFDIIAELVFSKPFGFLEKGIDIGDSLSQTMAFECYISIAGFVQWLHNLLVANPLVTWLDIMPTNYLVNTSNAALEERKTNQDARFDFVAHWLRSHAQNPDKLSYREVQSAIMANVGYVPTYIPTRREYLLVHGIGLGRILFPVLCSPSSTTPSGTLPHGLVCGRR